MAINIYETCFPIIFIRWEYFLKSKVNQLVYSQAMILTQLTGWIMFSSRYNMRKDTIVHRRIKSEIKKNFFDDTIVFYNSNLLKRVNLA